MAIDNDTANTLSQALHALNGAIEYPDGYDLRPWEIKGYCDTREAQHRVAMRLAEVCCTPREALRDHMSSDKEG
jgi:hypothetical protein